MTNIASYKTVANKKGGKKEGDGIGIKTLDVS